MYGPKSPKVSCGPDSVTFSGFSWKLSRRCSKMVKVRSPKRCTDSCHLPQENFWRRKFEEMRRFEINDSHQNIPEFGEKAPRLFGKFDKN